MTNGGHWSDEDFINHVYGIGPEEGHLAVCGECRARADAIRARRAFVTREPEVPLEFLAEQRRRIHRRLEVERGAMNRFVPALGAVLLLLAGLFFLYQSPRPQPVPAPVSASDSQLFSDIYALEQTSEPHVAKPMRALFEEN